MELLRKIKKDIINNLNITIKTEPIFDGSNLVDDREENEQQIGDVRVVRHFKGKNDKDKLQLDYEYFNNAVITEKILIECLEDLFIDNKRCNEIKINTKKEDLKYIEK